MLFAKLAYLYFYLAWGTLPKEDQMLPKGIV
jgi:hypothetical protein